MPSDTAYNEFIAALEAFDRSGGKDKEPLLEYLCRRGCATRTNYWFYLYLADLFDRYQFNRPSNRPRTPLYTSPDLYRYLAGAKREMKFGVDLEDAAERWGLLPSTLEKSYLGKNSAERRFMKRRAG